MDATLPRTPRLGLFALLGFALAHLATAQPPPVSVDLRPVQKGRDALTVGDHVQAKLTLVWDGDEPAQAPRFPAWQETWGKAEILAVSEVELHQQGPRRIYSQTLLLTAFETGVIELPESIVSVPLADETVDMVTRPASFEVTSVLPAPEGSVTQGSVGSAADIEPRPPAPLRMLPEDLRFLATNTALGVACLLAFLWLRRRLRRAAEVATALALPPRVLSPYEEFQQALELTDPADAEAAHTALSTALRRYLGRSFAFNALESTTSEIQRRLQTADLPYDFAKDAVQTLRDCDAVKFARLDISPETTTERFGYARDLVQAIEEILRPVEDEDEDEDEHEEMEDVA